jgi:hypothetical protein
MAARKKLLADIDRLDDWQAKSSKEYKEKKERLSSVGDFRASPIPRSSFRKKRRPMSLTKC